MAEYRPGPRKRYELQALLTHAGQLLGRQGWHKLFGDQRFRSPFTPEEAKWVTKFWLSAAQRRTNELYGAVLLPYDVFARLAVNQVMQEAKACAMALPSFRGKRSGAAVTVESASAHSVV